MIARIARIVVFLVLALPGIDLLLAFATGALATPYRTILHETGLWSARLLVLGLLLSPIARLSRQAWLTAPRRMIGLFAAAYAFVHAWAWCRQYRYDWLFLLGELPRLYLLLGLAAVLMLVPLTLTSNAAARRALGAAWARLHQLAWPIAITAVLHFALSRAFPTRESLLLGGLLVVAAVLRALASRLGK
ncbi:MAG: ferric reductase-like transmembrane domain-containing protein [Alphaproteobacteria bacterium]|nr:ferric reductase-like transmembrane domain-containing protein [Alphaproteobacteria bacterium]